MDAGCEKDLGVELDAKNILGIPTNAYLFTHQGGISKRPKVAYHFRATFLKDSLDFIMACYIGR